MSIKDRNLKVGTKLVAQYKNAEHQATVVKGEEGKVRYRLKDGQEFSSPSAAGSAVMGGAACNGWRFWSVEGSEEAKARPKGKGGQKSKAKGKSKAKAKTTAASKSKPKGKPKPKPKSDSKAKKAKSKKAKKSKAEAKKNTSGGDSASPVTFE